MFTNTLLDARNDDFCYNIVLLYGTSIVSSIPGCNVIQTESDLNFYFIFCTVADGFGFLFILDFSSFCGSCSWLDVSFKGCMIVLLQIVVIDLILHKPEAYRHIFFNYPVLHKLNMLVFMTVPFLFHSCHCY